LVQESSSLYSLKSGFPWEEPLFRNPPWGTPLFQKSDSLHDLIICSKKDTFYLYFVKLFSLPLSDPSEWKEQQQGEHQQQQHQSFDDPSASQHQLSPNQIEPSFDEYSNDPFLLQEFTNANSLGGIVCVENSLHQNSSAESTPGGIRQFGQQRPLNPYSKFFNEFSSAFLGGNGENFGIFNVKI